MTKAVAVALLSYKNQMSDVTLFEAYTDAEDWAANKAINIAGETGKPGFTITDSASVNLTNYNWWIKDQKIDAPFIQVFKQQIIPHYE